MAGNEKSGRSPQFHLSDKELQGKIDDYKRDLEAGEFARASWPHFASYLDSTEAELALVMKSGCPSEAGCMAARKQNSDNVIDANMGSPNSEAQWNHYKVHRFLTPEGLVFQLLETKNEAALSDGGVTENGSLATPNGTASLEKGVIGETSGHRREETLVPPSTNTIHGDGGNVNPAESVGTAPAGFTGKQGYYDLLTDDNIQPARKTDVRPVEIPKTDG